MPHVGRPCDRFRGQRVRNARDRCGGTVASHPRFSFGLAGWRRVVDDFCARSGCSRSAAHGSLFFIHGVVQCHVSLSRFLFLFLRGAFMPTASSLLRRLRCGRRRWLFIIEWRGVRGRVRTGRCLRGGIARVLSAWCARSSSFRRGLEAHFNSRMAGHPELRCLVVALSPGCRLRSGRFDRLPPLESLFFAGPRTRRSACERRSRPEGRRAGCPE